MSIKLHGVTKIFNAGRPEAFRALTDVNLELELPTVTVFRGPSGSGKTTLLSLIGCMARPTAGRIHLRDREISSLPERFLTEIRRSTFGFVFQRFHLIRGLTVLENVMAPAYPTGEKYPLLRERALGILEQLNLRPRAEAKVQSLSGGEAQRAAIARALINNPAVLIADEPTAHLDRALSEEFLAIMGELKARGTTLLLASHDPTVCQWSGVDRVVEMRDGRIVGPGARP